MYYYFHFIKFYVNTSSILKASAGRIAVSLEQALEKFLQLGEVVYHDIYFSY